MSLILWNHEINKVKTDIDFPLFGSEESASKHIIGVISA
jgi:hypothetical protein